jgi:hypothetical protein
MLLPDMLFMTRNTKIGSRCYVVSHGQQLNSCSEVDHFIVHPRRLAVHFLRKPSVARHAGSRDSDLNLLRYSETAQNSCPTSELRAAGLHWASGAPVKTGHGMCATAQSNSWWPWHVCPLNPESLMNVLVPRATVRPDSAGSAGVVNHRWRPFFCVAESARVPGHEGVGVIDQVGPERLGLGLRA